MAVSEARGLPPGIAARPLVAADIPQALALVEEAGWNQVADDWRIFLDLGEATGLTDAAGRLVATAATLPHGGGVGWISMVLVTTAWRRRGLARWLLNEANARLEANGLAAWLDATPAGRAVYLGLGFADVWRLTRQVRPPPPLRAQRSNPGAAGVGVRDSWIAPSASPPRNDGGGTGDIAVRPLREADWPALVALDRAAFGCAREPLLRRLAPRLPEAALVAERGGRLVGFLLGRDGRVMRQLGPLVAEDAATAQALLAPALALPGRLVIDLADREAALRDWLAARGFAAERPYTRMVRGMPNTSDDTSRYVAIAGPELG